MIAETIIDFAANIATEPHATADELVAALSKHWPASLIPTDAHEARKLTRETALDIHNWLDGRSELWRGGGLSILPLDPAGKKVPVAPGDWIVKRGDEILVLTERTEPAP